MFSQPYLFASLALALLLLTPCRATAHPAHLLTPRDVFSQEEIAEIKRSKNFFYRRQMSLSDPVWMNTNRFYSQHFLAERQGFLSLDDVLHRVLTDAFPIRYQLERLYRGKLGIHARVGEALPGLNLVVGAGAPPLTLANAFSNLYGFLLPSNWLQVASEQRLYKATKYLLLRTVMDEVLNAKLAYIRQHQAIQDLETASFYLVHLQILMETVPTGTMPSEILLARVGIEGNRMAVQREEARLGFDALSLVMALDKADGLYSVNRINITDLTGFPAQVDDFNAMGEVYVNKELFLEEVVRRSVELKAIKEFYRMSKINIGVVATGQTIANIDNPNGQPRFALGFGYETIPNILIATSLARTARIDVQREFVLMLDNARRSFDYYTNAVESFLEGKRALEASRLAFINYLERVLSRGKNVEHVLVLIIAQLLDAELRFNRILHDYLRAQAYMDRFLMIDSNGVLNYLPDRSKVLEVFAEVKGKQLAEYRKEERIDQALAEVHHARHLAQILYEPSGYPFLADYTHEEIEAAVRRNIGNLLATKHLWYKSRAFYHTLAAYLDERHIALTKSETSQLRRRSANAWDRLFRRHRVFYDDPFERVDFDDFHAELAHAHPVVVVDDSTHTP